ncbi:glycerol-3-phosphate dehydrogenase/oxidase [Geopsychrobacter electrodiphilus]|uniref:glycerol-3-phosphate dehydrogenase/oxidase n=1 Tax=Geopsychrobacter electrodiphilus TaxID=225196 RepID=UPI00036A676F|nr:FAD-dependent oxidoreductase [Geopsychrobacter electrodiphilus]
MQRSQYLQHLKDGSSYDLLVIGGGATGCGVALDAASRGLKVALVEKNDFAEGTSSRSTKLVHGGVRYLEMAVKKLDRVQYNLVKDGLRERYTLLKNAPHLSNRLALVTPLYRWIDVPYVFAGLKLYDILAGKRSVGHSCLLSRKEVLRRFPTVKAEGLKAGVLYYDGQFHDARMALSLALTAAQQGAVIANHVAVKDLIKDGSKICGVQLCDSLTGKTWQVRAKGVINATGPFTDQIRRLDNPQVPKILSASSGIHIILDKRFAPPDTGLMIPQTEDGRVLFVLPWEDHALVGTTDEPAEISEHPKPLEAEIAYLLRHVTRYFNLSVERSDVKAVWSGLRPLVSDPQAVDTARLARDHILDLSPTGLLTIAGGKWTTYRKMAEDTVDHALKNFQLSPAIPACQTEGLAIIGGATYAEKGDLELSRKYGFDTDVAAYLNRTYGDQAEHIAILAKEDGGRRLVENHPVLEAEVLYAVRHEMAERVIDVLARRMPLALLDTQAARTAAPRVMEIMQTELGWDERRCKEEELLTEIRLTEAL